ncbi:hypothetical protein PTSG_00427 [Salpingoeca rosetta]|uniref:Mitochondrial import inner membrane translocase subunit TIM23 n=1 Tax=Salpingoeca rosetta (strain ATCC 50818 / BSB-021) TaxID=946362 RepID=F2TWG1_SALR5|nr:uncharacterized protein PTSG_00427 [Salpingoeca rosetta]EGD72407.1 hypothetical protein PTSG_00427 [Salpingoeca rosetta]|eukprot:XP_004998976.1 hypothetical protein PTSG_00427 [Salpingoeca rosetta]
MGDDTAHDLSHATGAASPTGFGQPTSFGGYQPFDPQAMMTQAYQSPYLALGNEAQTLNQPDFLFPSSAEKSRSLLERMSYSTGVSYLAGTIGGGLYGVVEGLRHPAATSNRLRVTTVLNAVGKRGPFLGNTLAVLSVMFHSINGGIIKARGEKDDIVNDVAAAVATGTLFRITSGPRAAAFGGLTGAGLAAAVYVVKTFLNREESTEVGKHEEKEYSD